MPAKPIEELETQVGESHPIVEGLAVEVGKVEEFARALEYDDPVYRETEAANQRGLESIPAPLTFTRTASFPRYRPEDQPKSPPEQSGLLQPFDLGFRWERCVHGEQEYEFERPVSVGDVLSADITLTDVYQRDGEQGGTMTFAVFELEYRDRNDDLVLTERQTVIEIGDNSGDADE